MVVLGYGFFDDSGGVVFGLQSCPQLWRLDFTICSFWALCILFILILMLALVWVISLTRINQPSFSILIQLVWVDLLIRWAPFQIFLLSSLFFGLTVNLSICFDNVIDKLFLLLLNELLLQKFIDRRHVGCSHLHSGRFLRNRLISF